MIKNTSVQVPQENSPRHFLQLDGLRAVATLAVLIQHSIPVSRINIGLMGVKLFFVLSGFLITGILLRERDSYQSGSSLFQLLKVFYVRRFLRIFPLYYFVLFLGFILAIPRLEEALPWHLTYTTNFLVARHGEFDANAPIFSHFWTLAIEEQFYLFWPIVIFLTPVRWLKWVLGMLILLGPLTRALMISLGYSGLAAKVVTPACFDSLGLGALLALFLADQKSQIKSWLQSSLVSWAIVLPVFLMVGFYAFTGKGYKMHIVLEDFAYSFLFAWLVGRASMGIKGAVGKVLQTKFLVYLGMISYGTYVYQGIVPEVLSAKLGWHQPEYHSLQALLYLIAVTFPVAVLSWHFFEKPLNDLKRFVPYPEKT